MSFMRPSDAFAPNSASIAGAENGIKLSAPLPTYTNDQIANYLVYQPGWTGGASFNLGASRSLTVNITGLSGAGQQLANWALDAWSAVTGITFNRIAGSAQITFDDTQAGASAGPGSYTGQGGTITTSSVNIGTQWIANYGTGIDSYSYMSYMHEIGHALGIAHAGNYDGSATYITQGPASSGTNHYLNDSWQATIMSYFSPYDNTAIAANWDYYTAGFSGVLTPMVADILALQILYGTSGNIHTGNSWYGLGSNVEYVYNQLDIANASYAFTIVDDGGIDKINFSNVTENQTVNLTPGSLSSVGGFVDNMIIMPGSIIENYISGSGNDDITGNTANNMLWGGAGNDIIRGGLGTDILRGGAGNDVLNGNGKGDMLIGEGGNDILRGGNGKDHLDGGAGNDRLVGGIGRDKLVGGAGADTFVFNSGWAVDRVSDFQDNIDTIELNSLLWGGGYMSNADIILNFGSVVANNGNSVVANNGNAGFHVELNFGGGDILKIHGITDVNVLLDDITII